MSFLLGALCACQIAGASPDPGFARTAAELLARARAARFQQDSALQDYRAMAKQRWTAKLGVAPGLGMGPVSRLRLGARLETVARVGWHHQYGAWAELIGARAVAPIAGEMEPDIVDDEFAITVPYHPGRDALWPTDELVEALPGRDGLFSHPLDPANDSLYRFALGDPLDLTLPGGRRIGLRELLVRPVRPDARLVVGSLWVDATSGALVRAAYRPSVAVDLWPYMEGNFDDDDAAMIRKFGPFEGKVEEILIEHGLFEERFWLPTVRIAHAEGTAKGARVTMSIEQTFAYELVRALPPGVVQATQPNRDSLRRWGDDTGPREYRHLEYIGDGRYERRRVTTCRESGDTTAVNSPDSLMRRRDLYTESSVEGLRVRVLFPCRLESLLDTPALPPSIYDPSEELFTETDLSSVRQEVEKALAIGSQADWQPQAATYHYGWDKGLLRYNRIEGLSAGVMAERELGKGLSIGGLVRLGVGDLVPNATLTLRRVSGHEDVRLAVFSRLESMNAWGAPFGLSSSLNALLLGKDEHFYYRTVGVELAGSSARISGRTAVAWRLFAESHRPAEVGTDFSMARLIAQAHFVPNPPASDRGSLGAATTISFARGDDPRGPQLSGNVQLEGADGNEGGAYGRGALELRLSQGLGRATTVALNGSAGTSIGALPVQRHWYLGGASTIHAHRPGAMSGDGYWFARAEVTRGWPIFRPILFADLGWAGDRDEWLISRERMWAAGIGGAALDGLIRVDISKALDRSKRWSFDIFLELR